MARNKTPGDTPRIGAVKPRSQVKNEVTGTRTKRVSKTRKSSAEAMEEIVKRRAELMKRLAKR